MARILSNLTIVTMNEAREIRAGDIVVDGSEIRAVGGTADVGSGDEVIDCSGRVAIPGLIQPHIHLCQTLFRNQADDLSLLDWLRQRIWPMEAAHDDASLYASARLGIAELLAGGTTSILDMGTVHHTDAIFRAADEMGIRAGIGKTIMDRPDPHVPAHLLERSADALQESDRLAEAWHGHAGGRLRYAFAPRFVVACTEESLVGCAERARELGTPLHTHASENTDEVKLVRELTGRGNLEYLADINALAGAAIAHCIHLDDGDLGRLEQGHAAVTHCPSSNLKLASGIAPVPAMLEAGITVGIAADGAACANNLDAFLEMRLAALIHKPGNGPHALPAATVLEMATLHGARAVGLAEEIGSLEAGKKADIAVLDLDHMHSTGGDDLVARIVYSARSDNVDTVLVDGRIVKRGGSLVDIDPAEVRGHAHEAWTALQRRIK